MWIATATFIGGLVIVLILVSTFRCRKRLKYRMEFTYVDSCNWFRWIYWLLEILYVPLLVNAAWCGNCQFVTQRKAFTVTTCYSHGTSENKRTDVQMLIYYALKVGVALAILWATLYNLTLLWII